MELCVPSHRASNKCNVHVKLLDLTLQIYGPLKYCSACMKSVNGKWTTRRSTMGIPLPALHARGGRLQVKQVWGTKQFLRQSWLGHLLKLKGFHHIFGLVLNHCCEFNVVQAQVGPAYRILKSHPSSDCNFREFLSLNWPVWS
ncbi:uncharacterized protein [Gossypium hirsutum]|uniref:Uncharacterized protein isoform X2 n=1 Tax=Gossypium hirsutum TaxID=3635 RepID=A0ABM3BHE5_GOSHI|nr:uncharacterized protein LOC121227518 isoform X2 [Gossypium hirsutum]